MHIAMLPKEIDATEYILELIIDEMKQNEEKERGTNIYYNWNWLFVLIYSDLHSQFHMMIVVGRCRCCRCCLQSKHLFICYCFSFVNTWISWTRKSNQRMKEIKTSSFKNIFFVSFSFSILIYFDSTNMHAMNGFHFFSSSSSYSMDCLTMLSDF